MSKPATVLDGDWRGGRGDRASGDTPRPVQAVPIGVSGGRCPTGPVRVLLNPRLLIGVLPFLLRAGERIAR